MTRRERALWFRQIKESSPCLVCVEDDPCCIEFHHLDPKTKKGNVSHMVRTASVSLEDVLEEMKKCVPLCSNCHKKVHVGAIIVRRLVSEEIENEASVKLRVEFAKHANKVFLAKSGFFFVKELDLSFSRITLLNASQGDLFDGDAPSKSLKIKK